MHMVDLVPVMYIWVLWIEKSEKIVQIWWSSQVKENALKVSRLLGTSDEYKAFLDAAVVD